MKKYLSLAFRLALIVAVVVAMLAVVNALTRDTIADRQKQESEAARAELLSGSFRQLSADVIPAEQTKTVKAVYAAEKDGAVIGYCMDVTVNGFGGAITMIVGMNTDLTITGVKILTNAETPGVGSKAVDENGALIPQFDGLSSRNLSGVVTVTGATISSKAILSGVTAAAAVGKSIQEGGGH